MPAETFDSMLDRLGNRVTETYAKIVELTLQDSHPEKQHKLIELKKQHKIAKHDYYKILNEKNSSLERQRINRSRLSEVAVNTLRFIPRQQPSESLP